MGLAEQVQGAGEDKVCERTGDLDRSPSCLPRVCKPLTCSPQTRSFAAILFRRVATKTRKLESGQNVDLFLSVARDQAAVIRQKLLEALGTEPDRGVRNKIGDAVAEVARQYSETGIAKHQSHAS